MECKCTEFSKLDRIPAQGMNSYAAEHLKLESVDYDEWQSIWACPTTGIKFLKKFTQPETHGGGIPIWTVIESQDRQPC